MNSSVKLAVESAGGVAKVAEAIGISRISVYEWITKNSLPDKRVIPLAEMTAWRFTPHMLDPVLYPHKHDGLPDAIREAMAAEDRRSLRERRRYADRRAAARKAAAAAAALKATP